MLVRQPAAGFEQAAKPLLHVGAQVPPPQLVALAFCVLHCTPQAPQLTGSAAVGVSQPLPGLLSQSAWLAVHTGMHALPTQLLLLVKLSAQVLLHAPQLALLVRVSISQPLVLLPSQLLK